MKAIDCQGYLDIFLKDRDLTDRYASFDFCFNYFQSFQNKQEIVSPENIEKSCLHLGFYLASRGMYRGSSFLLTKSMKIYEDLLHVVVEMDPKIRTMDIENYPGNEPLILDAYNQIKNSLVLDNERHIVLVTKIMLGVFGCIPAYDQFFTKGMKDISGGDCGFTSVNQESLGLISTFYQENKKIIDTYAQGTETLRFSPQEASKLYTQAKIVDMIGFTYGLKGLPREG